MPHDLFISYSASDTDEAAALCELIEGAGFRCWIAPRDIPLGSTWPAAIASAIAESKLFVLLFSSTSVRSAEVARELERAMSRKIDVLPVRLAPVPPEGDFEYYLSNVQWMDAFEGVRIAGGHIVQRIADLLNEARQPPTGLSNQPAAHDAVHPDDWGRKPGRLLGWRRFVGSFHGER